MNEHCCLQRVTGSSSGLGPELGIPLGAPAPSMPVRLIGEFQLLGGVITSVSVCVCVDKPPTFPGWYFVQAVPHLLPS